MEWYWLLVIVAVFIAMFVLLVYLFKKNNMDESVVKILSGISNGVSTVLKESAKAFDSPVLNVLSLVTSLVEKCVLAAENAYYNEVIDKDQRKTYCVLKLNELLEAYNIELTEVQWQTVDTLIAAVCEQIGHTIVIDEVK